MPKKLQFKKGFTLIELLVVVSIISLLASVVLASVNTARARGRDAKRKQDLVQMRTAITSYYLDYNSYPLGFVGGWNGISASGCGGTSGNGTTSGANAYIQGLTPNYISVLPTDPNNPAGTCVGYLYYSTGTDYKFMIFNSPESTLSPGQQFYDSTRGGSVWSIFSDGGAGF